MNLKEEIKKNQARIRELITSMSIWANTPYAQQPDVQAKIDELQERTLHRLAELEVEGQNAKIASMEKVISLLKGQTKPTDI